MKSPSRRMLLCACAIIALASGRCVSAEQAVPATSERVMFSFDDPDDSKQWQIVNDGVMGGRSSSSVSPVDDGKIRFAGNLSLENNGGFASVRSKPMSLNLNRGEVIAMRIRGDGRKYMLNLYVPERRMAFSYQAEFETEADRWIEVRLPLTTFAATSFGNRIEGNELRPNQVHALGVMLADKKAGPFELVLDWIKVEPAQ